MSAGLRLRYLKTYPHYAAKSKTVRGFVRSFRADADHYLKNRSKYDDKRTERPRFDPGFQCHVSSSFAAAKFRATIPYAAMRNDFKWL